jgi:hypothetical protein
VVVQQIQTVVVDLRKKIVVEVVLQTQIAVAVHQIQTVVVELRKKIAVEVVLQIQIAVAVHQIQTAAVELQIQTAVVVLRKSLKQKVLQMSSSLNTMYFAMKKVDRMSWVEEVEVHLVHFVHMVEPLILELECSTKEQRIELALEHLPSMVVAGYLDLSKDWPFHTHPITIII